METKDQKKEITELIREAVVDMEDFFTIIKKSNKLLKYRDNGDSISDIYFNIIASFSISQLIEFAVKSKMISNKTGKPLTRGQRVQFALDKYERVFNYMLKQFANNGGAI